MLSKAGIGSRTEARRWVGEGRVQVNGRVEGDPNRWVDLERDRITFDGKPLEKAAATYLLLHKPAGYLTTYRDPEGRKTIYDLLPDRDRYLFPVGRLDLDTSGLLILTNDTAFAERLTNPDYHVPKTYRVQATRHLHEEELDRLRNGLELRDGPTRPAIVSRVRESGGKTTSRSRSPRAATDRCGGWWRRSTRRSTNWRASPSARSPSASWPTGETRELTQEELAALQ